MAVQSFAAQPSAPDKWHAQLRNTTLQFVHASLRNFPLTSGWHSVLNSAGKNRYGGAGMIDDEL
jgi:hypothetical protein